MKIIVGFAFVIFVFGGYSQQLLPIQHDTNTYSHELIVAGVGDFGSTSIKNEMSKKFLFGGDITQTDKDNSFGRHRTINRLGMDVTGEIEYRNFKVNLFKKENLGFIVKGGYYNYLSMVYSKDLFGLTFYGNENYLGENINFSGSRFSTMSFQKIGFGVIDKKSKANVCLNFYSISNYADVNVRDGQLFQSESGDSVSLTLSGTFEYSSENTFVKGYGVGIDLDFRIPAIILKDRISYIQFLAKNVGIASLNSPITRYSVDTLFNYDGLTFDQLYGESSIFDGNFSYLDTLGIDSTTTTKIRFLPGFLQVGKIVDEMSPARVQSFFGIRMYPSVAYVPLIYAGAQIRTTNWLDLGINISYGGFSRFRTGLYAQFDLKMCAVGISTEDLVGVISKNGMGQSIILRLRMKI